MIYTAIGILVGAVVGGLLMFFWEGDTVMGVASVAVVGATGAGIDMVAAKRRPRQSQVHTA